MLSKKLAICITLTSIFLLTSCSVQNTKSRNLFESFYIGEGVNQYFIKPINFKDSNNNVVEVDFTLRSKETIIDSIIYNLSFFTKTNYSIDSIHISNKDTTLKISSYKLLFKERNKNIYITRISTKNNAKSFIKLFSNPNWKIIVFNKKNKDIFLTHKTTEKKINSIQTNLINLYL